MKLNNSLGENEMCIEGTQESIMVKNKRSFSDIQEDPLNPPYKHELKRQKDNF